MSDHDVTLNSFFVCKLNVYQSGNNLILQPSDRQTKRKYLEFFFKVLFIDFSVADALFCFQCATIKNYVNVCVCFFLNL